MLHARVRGLVHYLIRHEESADIFPHDQTSLSTTMSDELYFPWVPKVDTYCLENLDLYKCYELEHGLITKIFTWGPLTSVTDVRSFLGTAGVGRKRIRGS
jgi:hypothetical protein